MHGVTDAGDHFVNKSKDASSLLEMAAGTLNLGNNNDNDNDKYDDNNDNDSNNNPKISVTQPNLTEPIPDLSLITFPYPAPYLTSLNLAYSILAYPPTSPRYLTSLALHEVRGLKYMAHPNPTHQHYTTSPNLTLPIIPH